MSECMIPSFEDVTIWPYDVQIKGGSTRRVNASGPRKAQREAMLKLRKGAKSTGAEPVVVTAQMMWQILGIESALTKAEMRELAAR